MSNTKKQWTYMDWSSTDTMDYVRDFAEKFDVTIPASPGFPSKEIITLRLAVLEEELDEVKRAIKERDLVNLLKELSDLQYVLDGAYLAFGLDRLKIPAMREVHKSNLSKLGPNGEVIRREDGKILKGKDYQPADIEYLMPMEVWRAYQQKCYDTLFGE